MRTVIIAGFRGETNEIQRQGQRHFQASRKRWLNNGQEGAKMELINGRTAEEIKHGLRVCNGWCGSECPYSEIEYGCASTMVRDALALIEHLESQTPRWISVEDVPPKENVYYMVSVTLYGNRGMYTDIAMFDGELWVRDAGSYFDILDKGDITHYMPLPEPPKEGAHE